MNIYHRLDDVQMSAIDREHAKAHMRSAELTIDFVAVVVARTRSIGAALGRPVSQPGAPDPTLQSPSGAAVTRHSHDMPCSGLV